ncbi:MAG: hypothetical protein EOP09_09960 [Proteobacteria bacterium]|nr:MAG: hypothetical protein EOP09_09960 [Pseudomonadota bacterium]
MDFKVNGGLHVQDSPVIVGDLQVWEVNNVSLMDHPFHLHGFFFQVLEINGKAPRSRELRNNAGGEVSHSLDGDKPGELAFLLDSKIHSDDCVKTLQSLRFTTFSLNDQDLALQFLSGEINNEVFSRQSYFWIADELLTCLRVQPSILPELIPRLIRIAEAPNTDQVIKDYIVQHLGHLWEAKEGGGLVEQYLTTSLDSGRGTVPGTALIALKRGFEREDRMTDANELQKRAAQIVRDPETDMSSRVTALALLGDSGNPIGIDFAHQFVNSPDTPAILHRVAVGILERNLYR